MRSMLHESALMSLTSVVVITILFRSKTSVVVDPVLGKFLRPHQRQGVQFLYNCITGQGGFKGNGAILADEM